MTRRLVSILGVVPRSLLRCRENSREKRLIVGNGGIRVRAGLLTGTMVVIQHLNIRRHLRHLAPYDGRRGRSLNDVAMDGFNEVVFLVVTDVDQEVGVGRVACTLIVGRGFGRAGEDLVNVGDFGNIAVIVFAPDFFLRVEDVDPVVAEAGGPAMEECGV